MCRLPLVAEAMPLQPGEADSQQATDTCNVVSRSTCAGGSISGNHASSSSGSGTSPPRPASAGTSGMTTHFEHDGSCGGWRPGSADAACGACGGQRRSSCSGCSDFGDVVVIVRLPQQQGVMNSAAGHRHDASDAV